MAATCWDPELRKSFVARLAKLTPDSKPRWGKMSAAAMAAHLNDSARMALADLPVKSKGARLRYWPVKQLILFVLPFPRGAPTAPELIARCDTASLDEEQKQFAALMDRLGTVSETTRLGEHPAFGVLTHKEYGALIAKHTEHHFRQFGL
jgi:DinB superfamily